MLESAAALVKEHAELEKQLADPAVFEAFELPGEIPANEVPLAR